MAEFTQIPGTMRRAGAQPDRESAARRAIAWRVERGLLDHEGALNVLLALGLRKEPVVEPVKPQRVTPEQDPVTKRWLKRTEETA